MWRLNNEMDSSANDKNDDGQRQQLEWNILVTNELVEDFATEGLH